MTSEATRFFLTDGRELVIRDCEPAGDLKALCRFFSELPAEIRNPLRYGVTDEEILRARLAQLDGQNHWRVVAELEGRIVGDAILDREPYSWTRHVACLRGVVAPDVVDLGAARPLFRGLVAIGAAAGIELLYSEVADSDVIRRSALEDAGFVQEGIRRRYAKTSDGVRHDLIVMANDLEAIWHHLGLLLEEMDQPDRSS